MITYKSLREIERKEKKEKGELTKLDEDFFDEVGEYLVDLDERKKELKNSKDFFDNELLDQINQEITNSKRTIQKILEHRTRKILEKALSNSRVREEIKDENMTKKEQELFDKVTKLFSNHNKELLKTIFDLETRQKNRKSSETVLKQSEVKVLEKVSEFVWSDGKAYGPFKEGENTRLPKEVANFLVENKRAKEVKK